MSEPREIRTVCMTCHGAGLIEIPTLTIIGGTPGTSYPLQRCKHCSGRGTQGGVFTVDREL